MPEIKTILGTDGLWWWTTSLTPTAASYKGANNSRNGFDTEAEAREAGEAAEEEASDHTFDLLQF